jgi:hypothetical protein
VETKRNEKILDFYFTKQTVVHVRCNNHRFYNGKIAEINFDKRLIVLDDVKIGPVPILFDEIWVVEPYREEKDG